MAVQPRVVNELRPDVADLAGVAQLGEVGPFGVPRRRARVNPTGPAYDPGVDTFLAIASKRDTRRYADTPIPDDVERRIVEAGRVTGQRPQWQPWRFLLVESPDRRESADAVYEPTNVRGAQLVVAIVSSSSMDPAAACRT